MTRHFSTTFARTTMSAVALSFAVGMAGCAPAATFPPGQPAPPGTGVVLTDADIAGIFLSANTAEIERGQLALQRSQNEAVRQFAQRMVTDHNQALQRAQNVVSRRGITPAPGTITQQLGTAQQQTMQSLGARTGADFDRTYIAQEIANHEWLLQSIDSALLPGARSSDVRNLLMETRPTVQAHLQQARQIQGQIGQPQQAPGHNH